MTSRSYKYNVDGLTGANTLDVSRIGMDQALFTNDETLLMDAYTRSHKELVIVNGVKADGIRADGAFGELLEATTWWGCSCFFCQQVNTMECCITVITVSPYDSIATIREVDAPFYRQGLVRIYPRDAFRFVLIIHSASMPFSVSKLKPGAPNLPPTRCRRRLSEPCLMEIVG